VYVTAIVLEAGEGRRIGGPTPKSYLSIAGRPIVLRALDKFFLASTINNVILVVAPDELQRCADLLRADPSLSAKPLSIQRGGATRQASVLSGLEKLDSQCDCVVIHEAARPFITAALIDRCVDAARHDGAVIVGVPVRDTIKIVSNEFRVVSTPPRDALWEIHTPQVFRKELILAAHARALCEKIEATDDAMLVEQIQGSVRVIEGDRTNIKITTTEDLVLAEALLAAGRAT
jgi:2-C-methyl-D-erythritol 4-phosphate cytidylyltransferase